MKTFAFVAAVSAALVLAAPVAAGQGKFVRASDGMELEIRCRNSGCTVRGKAAGGNWGNVERGPGGGQNYQRLVAKYTAMGFAEQ